MDPVQISYRLNWIWKQTANDGIYLQSEIVFLEWQHTSELIRDTEFDGIQPDLFIRNLFVDIPWTIVKFQELE